MMCTRAFWPPRNSIIVTLKLTLDNASMELLAVFGLASVRFFEPSRVSGVLKGADIYGVSVNILERAVKLLLEFWFE